MENPRVGQSFAERKLSLMLKGAFASSWPQSVFPSDSLSKRNTYRDCTKAQVSSHAATSNNNNNNAPAAEVDSNH